METTIEFMKLEKIELGGVKGTVLSQQVIQLFEEFNALYGVYITRSYDCLETTKKSASKKGASKKDDSKTDADSKEAEVSVKDIHYM